MESAKQWLKGTFLFVRLQKNPHHYRLGEIQDNQSPDVLLNRICNENVKLLQEFDLITSSATFESTAYGNTMAQYYVLFESMKRFMTLPQKAKISEIVCYKTQRKI